MHLSTIDRNRMTVAAVLTAIALPLMFMASGRSADSASTSVVDTTTSTIESGLASDPDAEVDAPANLAGPVIGNPNGQGQIAYPADNTDRTLQGSATFRRLPLEAARGCSTALVALGAEITVRNLNNSRKITCTNINIGPLPVGVDIVLNTRLFESLADLIDAPLPVEMSW